LKLLQDKFPKFSVIHEKCEEGVLDHQFILETLSDDKLLEDELDLKNGIAWKNYRRKARTAHSNRIARATNEKK